MTLNVFEHWTRAVFPGKTCNFELKSPLNMTLSERLLIASNNLKFGFPFEQ